MRGGECDSPHQPDVRERVAACNGCATPHVNPQGASPVRPQPWTSPIPR